MVNINIKPLSVNQVWQGKRFKTKAYKSYETELIYTLPDIKLPPPPYSIYFEFGFSNKGSDIDNPVKPFTDILQKRYGFNDRDIYEMRLAKKIVKKGDDYIKFEINHLPKLP